MQRSCWTVTGRSGMELEFTGELFYQRGPGPLYFVSVPSADVLT
jgi:hypothetical protein